MRVEGIGVSGFRVQGPAVSVQGLLGGSWAVISGVISPLIWGYKYSYPTYNPTCTYP